MGGSRDSQRIELRQLIYVIAAADHGSFRQAALAVGVRESAISRRIRDLEDHAGTSLFIRYQRGVLLTEAGRKFVMHARRAVSEIDLAVKDVRSEGRVESGILRIGIFTSLASGFISDLLESYDRQHPGILTKIIEGTPDDHMASVRRHEIDIAFLTGHPQVAGCEVTKLWCEHVFVVLPEAHELTAKELIEWSDLRGRQFIVSESEPGPEIHNYILRHLSEPVQNPSIERCPVYNRDTLMQLVAMGKGISLTSEATTGTRFRGVAYRQLLTDKLPFCAVWSQRNDNPALRRMLSLARSMSAKHYDTRKISSDDPA